MRRARRPKTSRRAPDQVGVLPYTGLRVPDERVRVTSVVYAPCEGGVALTATVRLGRRRVGTLESAGDRPLRFYPRSCSRLSEADMAVWAAGANTAAALRGVADVYEWLIAEHRAERAVRALARRGGALLRVRSDTRAPEFFAYVPSPAAAPGYGRVRCMISESDGLAPVGRWEVWTPADRMWHPLTTIAETEPCS
jgi:hypothetical protein